MDRKKIKILAIDDNKDNLIILNDLIKEAFPEAIYLPALNGTQGLELAANEDPDVILLDIIMPVMDGFDVCRNLKADKNLCDIPVVFVTSLKSDKMHRIHALQCGSEAFLSKPIDESELTALIRAMVKIKAANIEKKNEKKRLATLVLNRTKILERDIKQRKLAEEALRRSEADLREAQQVGRLGSWDWDATTDTITWSEEYYRIYGIDPTQYPPGYEEHLKLYTPESAAQLDEAVKKSMESGIPYELDLELAHAAGPKQWITSRCEIKYDANGQVIGLRGTAHDITERKLAEDALRESKQIIEDIINAIPVRVFWKDKNLVYLGCNAAFVRDAGFSGPNDIIGKDDYQIGWRDQAELYRSDDLYVIGTGHSKLLIEEPQTTPEGNIITLLTSKLPLQNSSGEICGVIGTYMDITERKQSELALLVSEEKFRSIAEQTDDLIALTDTNGFITYASSASRVLFNIAPEEMCGCNFTEFLDETDTDKAIAAFRVSIDRGEKTRDLELKMKRKDGSLFIGELNGSIYRGEVQNGTLVIIHDITERKQLEEKRMESIIESGRSKVAALNLLEDLKMEVNVRKQAEIALMESKNLLEKVNKHEIDIREEERAVISREIHDQLGQSMTALKMDLSWLQHNKLKENEAYNKIENMQGLISDTIKDIQRISSDLRPGILDDLGLASAIEWYCEEFSNRTGLKIQTDVEAIQTDDPHKNITIYRVLQESLTNIIRHARAEKVLIKLNKVENDIELTILDDGIGISPDKITATKSLGLLGMIERVKQSDGQMQISSPEEHGTEIKIIIPI